MHDTALTQAQSEGYLPTLAPRSVSVTEQLASLLQQVLVLAQHPTAVQAPSRPARGRPPLLPLPQLYLALLLGVLRQTPHLTTIWRRLYLQATGPFAPVHLTYEAIRSRLLRAGTPPWTVLSPGLPRTGALESAPAPRCPGPAPFAPQVVALDETTFDRVRRLTADLREVPNGDSHLLPGNWRVSLTCGSNAGSSQFRADVLAGCNTGILLLLEGLVRGSLILADLGYFSFAWFDYLSGQGYWWVSRFKTGTSYQMKEVLAYDDHSGLLDAIVWVGVHRADRAAYLARLVCFSSHGTQYRYLTNVLSPTQLSLHDIAALYARRWDIELAFKLLKCELGLHLWWGARPELVLIQLWIALILAQLLHALQLQSPPGPRRTV